MDEETDMYVPEGLPSSVASYVPTPRQLLVPFTLIPIDIPQRCYRPAPSPQTLDTPTDPRQLITPHPVTQDSSSSVLSTPVEEAAIEPEFQHVSTTATHRSDTSEQCSNNYKQYNNIKIPSLLWDQNLKDLYKAKNKLDSKMREHKKACKKIGGCQKPNCAITLYRKAEDNFKNAKKKLGIKLLQEFSLEHLNNMYAIEMEIDRNSKRERIENN